MKKFFTLIAFFAMTSFSAGVLQAQTEGWSLFMKFPINNISATPTVHQFGDLMFISNMVHDRFWAVDFMQNYKTFTPFSINAPAGINIENLRPLTIMNDAQTIYYSQIQTFGGGLFRLTNLVGNNPNMDFIPYTTFFGIEEMSGLYSANPQAVQFFNFPIPSNPQYMTWCRLSSARLIFTDRYKTDSVIAEFLFPQYATPPDPDNGFYVTGMYGDTDMLLNYSTFDLFFVPSSPPSIVKFNVNTQEFTRYKLEDLPLEYDTIPDATTIRLVRNSLMMTHRVTSWIIEIEQDAGNVKFYSTVLLTYTKDDGFKSVPLKPEDYTKYYVEGECPLHHSGRLNDTTIWFCYRNPAATTAGTTDYMHHTEIVTYDLVTGKYGSICIPPEIVANYPQDNQAYYPFPKSNTFVTSVTELKQPNGKKVIGILLNIGHFLFYDPTVSVAETENIFQELGIRNIYPNPVTFGTVTANIMYYVSDISTVELGLYDFMGKKVLDLSNQFEYEPATATISTTFEIPKSLAKGSYFLVVRSGKETRTRGIIVQ